MKETWYEDHIKTGLWWITKTSKDVNDGLKCDNNYETHHEANTIRTSMILLWCDMINLKNPLHLFWSFKLRIEWWRLSDADDWFIILHCKKSRENVEKSVLFSKIRVFFIWEKLLILRKKIRIWEKITCFKNPVIRIFVSLGTTFCNMLLVGTELGNIM